MFEAGKKLTSLQIKAGYYVGIASTHPQVEEHGKRDSEGRFTGKIFILDQDALLMLVLDITDGRYMGEGGL